MSLIQIDYTKKKTIIKISKYTLTPFLIFMILDSKGEDYFFKMKLLKSPS